MKIKRSELDEVIQTERDYYNHKISFAKRVVKTEYKVFGDEARWVGDIIIGITTKRNTHDEPNETYYKVLEALGFEIIEG